MPPWHADPRYGRFANDRRLSRDERDTLLAWIDNGAPRGDDKDLPPPLKFTPGWKIGEPDQVFTMAADFTVPSTGVLDYQRFVVDPGFKDDVWVQAAECRPGNRKVVHHIIVYVLPPGRREPYDADGTAATLVGWAPGDMPATYPPGIGRLVTAGSRLVFEVHYTPNGTEQTDRSSIGVKFARTPPAQRRRDQHPGEHDLPHSARRGEPQGANDLQVPGRRARCCRSCRTCISAA